MSADTALRRQAADLACAADDSALTLVFDGGGVVKYSDEFRAMVVHELVLAGHEVATHPIVGRWAFRRHGRRHGLGWLPLNLFDFETRDPRLPAVGSKSCGILADVSITLARTNIEVVETGSAEFARRAGLPFAHWVQHSNGKIDVHEYLIDRPVSENTIRDVLVTAAPEFLAGGDARRLQADAVALADVWWRLFRAASEASDYGPRQGGAYGRLHTWRSIAALCGAERAATPDDVAARARACSWFILDVTSTWFYAPWFFDLALACIGPDPDRVAVLAATDTD